MDFDFSQVREREREWILKSIPAETVFPKSISFPSISVPEILLEFGLKIVFLHNFERDSRVSLVIYEEGSD